MGQDRVDLALTMLRAALELRDWAPVHRAYVRLGGVATGPSDAPPAAAEPTPAQDGPEARQAYQRALSAAAAAIRAFGVEMRLTVLPDTHTGTVVVRDLREELAVTVEGLA